MWYLCKPDETISFNQKYCLKNSVGGTLKEGMFKIVLLKYFPLKQIRKEGNNKWFHMASFGKYYFFQDDLC